MTTNSYKKIVEHVLKRIRLGLVVNKPHVIHIIQSVARGISRNEANEIVKKMVVERKIDEHLALSKKERPYSFYTIATGKNNLGNILLPLTEILSKKRELSIADASRLTGYSPLLVRTLLTHLVLNGLVDYRGELDSPVFYIPWDAE